MCPLCVYVCVYLVYAFAGIHLCVHVCMQWAQ